MASNTLGWDFVPVTPDRWEDLEALFGPSGACWGCWCMWWRVRRSRFDKMRAAERKEGLKSLVMSGQPPGLLAYRDGQPAGWCSVGPRESYPALEFSRVLKRLDDRPVWSVVCFFIAKAYRRQGLSRRLLKAAMDYAVANGARIIEGYPREPGTGTHAELNLFTGSIATFRQAGFAPAEANPRIWRYVVDGIATL